MFDDKKIERICNEDRSAMKALGATCAKRLRQRLDDLRAATTLDDMRMLPGRCHELTGDLTGFLALDLVHPLRLLIAAANDPEPRKPDGGLDWSKITAIRVCRIEDYHG